MKLFDTDRPSIRSTTRHLARLAIGDLSSAYTRRCSAYTRDVGSGGAGHYTSGTDLALRLLTEPVVPAVTRSIRGKPQEDLPTHCSRLACANGKWIFITGFVRSVGVVRSIAFLQPLYRSPFHSFNAKNKIVMPALSTALPLRSYLTARNIIITTVAGLALILFLSSSSSTSAAAGIVKSSALRTIYSPSQAKQAFILAKQQLQDLSTASAGGRNRFNPTVARSVFDLADQSFVDTTQKKYPCPANLMDVIADAADPTPVNRKNPSPQLNLEQLTWIANTVRTSAYLRNGQANNFLVHGLGHDSLIWRSANCLPTNPNGRE